MINITVKFFRAKIKIVKEMKTQKIIEWDDSIGIGITWIDNQHKKMLDRINSLFNAIMQGFVKDEVTETVAFLEKYAKFHFNAEEKYMQQYDFDGLELQKSQHNNFMKKVTDIKSRIKTQGPSKKMAITIEKDLLNWFFVHIKNLDAAFGDYLRANYDLN